MAHPYGTDANMETLLGEARFDALCLMTGSQTPEAVYAQSREDADGEIDAALAQAYSVPFSTVPGLITTISNNLTAAYLYRKRHPQGEDYKTYRDEAEQLLERILAGTYELPGATKVPANEGAMGVARLEVDGAEPMFAGTDENGDDRMQDW